MNRQSGFTLIELMIVLAVAAIFLTVGVPSFTGTIERNRLRSTADRFVNAVNVARSEAVKLGKDVSLRQVNSGGSGVWKDGWCIAEGSPANCAGTLIRSYPSVTSLNVTSTNTIFTFNAKGYSESSADIATFCAAGNADGRQVSVSAIGQARSATKTDCPTS